MRWLAIVVALASLAAQRPEQYEGQAQHAMPPEGWTCKHQTTDNAVPPDHVCWCDMHCMKHDDGTESIEESNKCAVWCHKEHCECAKPCEGS